MKHCNGLFMSPAFLECKIAIADFRKFLGANRIEGALNKKWLDVSTGPADSCGFLLPGTLIVLRRKPSPGAEMLRGGKHGHIHSNFRDDANRGTVFHFPLVPWSAAERNGHNYGKKKTQ